MDVLTLCFSEQLPAAGNLNFTFKGKWNYMKWTRFTPSHSKGRSNIIGLQWWEFLQRSKDSQNLISGSSDLRSWVHIDSYKSFSLKILANFHSNTLWVPWANSTRVEKKHLVLFSSWNRLLHLLKMLRTLYLCYDFFNISKNNFSN